MAAPNGNIIHQHYTRKLLVSFMELFNNLYVEKYQWDIQSNNFTNLKYVRIPIMYSTAQKFYQIYKSSSARKIMPPEASIAPVEMQWILPRLAVNLQNIVFDTERHIPKLSEIYDNEGNYTYAPVPYNLEIELASISKTIDDAFQMMEQILPMFSPGKSIDVKMWNEIPESVPITLNSVSFDFPSEISENDERLFMVNYYLTMRANYYPQPKLATLITNVSIVNSMGIHINIEDTKFQTYVENVNNPNPFLTPNDEYGNLTLKRKGEYSSEITYNKLDLVTFNNNLFVWINDTPGNIEPGKNDWEKYWTFRNVVKNNVVEVTEV